MRLNAPNHSDSNAWADPSVEEHTTNTVADSSSTFQFYNGKMPTAFEARDYELDRNCVLAPRFKTGDFIIDSEISVHWDSSTEGLMWTILVVPIDIERNLPPDGILTQRNENAPGAFVLYGAHQSFNNGDASVLANSTEPLLDALWFGTAPRTEICRDKLTSLIGNEMSWRTSDRTNSLGHERNNLVCGRLFLEHGEANDRTGEMVNHHNDPPTEWPNLRQAKWRPWYPESCCRDSSHVNMPNVVGISCGDHSLFLSHSNDVGIGFVWERIFFHDATDGGGAEMKSCSGQYLSYSHLAHSWTKGFEPLDDIADIVGVLVHRLGKLEEPILGIASSLHPVGNGFGFDHEGSGGLCKIPGTGGLEFQDGHSHSGSVLGTLSRGNCGHACIFDSDFLLKQGVFILNAVKFSCETNPFDATIDGEAPGVGDCAMGQGDAVDDRQLDMLGPILGKRNTLKWVQIAHKMLSESS